MNNFKLTPDRVYQTDTDDFVVFSDGLMPNFVGLIRDYWEDFNETSLERHFEQSYKIFIQELKNLKDLHRPLTTAEEKKLTFMMEALIQAKNAARLKDHGTKSIL